MNKHIIKRKPYFILFPILCFFGIAAIVMWLWNILLPDIIGVKKISYWQAIGIFVLSKILFGGFRVGKGCGRSRKMGMNTDSFDTKLDDKDKFKEEFKKRFQTRFCK